MKITYHDPGSETYLLWSIGAEGVLTLWLVRTAV
jgi:hypothetical protein